MTRHFDIAAFEVDRSLQARLGYDRIYAAGKDVQVSSRPSIPGVPSISIGRDAGTLITELRKPDVMGIAFEGMYLDKKAVEKAAEYGKTVFMPVGRLVALQGMSRIPALNALRKLFFAAHALKARTAIVSMAGSKAQLLSTAQMLEIANLISGGQGAGGMGWGPIE